MCKCVNIKSYETCCMLFVEDSKYFTKTSDRRLPYSKSLAAMFESMYTYSVSSMTRVLRLTTYTNNALHITLNRTITLIVLLLAKIKYVLTAEFQSDRTEGKLGIYRQMDWGNYHISVPQALNSL